MLPYTWPLLFAWGCFFIVSAFVKFSIYVFAAGITYGAMCMIVQEDARPRRSSSFLGVTGYILAISYPVLALSTGVRALYQLFLKEDVTNYLAPSLSAVAALCYLTATIGFAYRRRWAWWLSVAVLLFETLMTLLIGSLSFVIPDSIGNTVWRHFGADYGYFPLFQPLLGLLWLFWPETLHQYGIRKARNAKLKSTTESEHVADLL